MSQGTVTDIAVFRDGEQIGENIDSGLALSLTIVETAALNGPKLMASFDDTENLFSEYYGLTEHDEIKVTVADNEDDAAIDYTFTAGAVVAGQQSTLSVEALESNTHSLHEMSGDFISVFNQSVEETLRRLCDITKINVFNTGDFVNVDMACATTQSRIMAIKRMAWELGAIAFVGRGNSMNLYSRSELYADPVEISGPIVKGLTRSGIGHNYMSELSRKSWAGWSMLFGPMSQGDGPVNLSPLDSPFLLSNLSKIPLIPYVDLPSMQGDLSIGAGDGIVLIAPGGNEDTLYSETLSGPYIVHTVAHNWKAGGAHMMRIMLAKYEAD